MGFRNVIKNFGLGNWKQAAHCEYQGSRRCYNSSFPGKFYQLWPVALNSYSTFGCQLALTLFHLPTHEALNVIPCYWPWSLKKHHKPHFLSRFPVDSLPNIMTMKILIKYTHLDHRPEFFMFLRLWTTLKWHRYCFAC